MSKQLLRKFIRGVLAESKQDWQYVYQQVLSTLQRRGATVSDEGEVVTGTFSSASDFKVAKMALTNKYKPEVVTVDADDATMTLTFNFH